VHNVNVDALNQTIERATDDPSWVMQTVSFDGAWQTDGGPQFTATIPVPNGEPVTFQADFPPPMGGTGSAPNPLAYCFWGGMACYAMTYAQEAAKQGIQLRSLRARAEAEVDQSRALGVTDNPPVQRIDWYLDVDAHAPQDKLDELKRLADQQCPGVYCVRNPVELVTHLETTT
jgi:uncharacterized OsmC-like protein